MPEYYSSYILYTSAYEEHWSRVQEPVEGTCAWVTKHPSYNDWLEKKTSGLLWLSGDPGCGKSVIASFLVTHLKTPKDARVCYFFFKDDNEEQRSARFALCAILHQLFVQRESLWVYAEEVFRVKGKRFTEEVDTLWNILVKAVSEGRCGDVVCVVDAWDECDEVTIAPLIRHVTRLPESRTSDMPLKFLVTSRPYHRIERELGSRATTIRLRGEDEISAVMADVTRVIDNGIEELERFWINTGGLGYLRDLLYEVGSREVLTNIASTAPASLDGLYTKILSKSTDSNRVRRVPNIVVAAARPLTLAEMNIALTIRRDHKSMRELSGNLHPVFERTVKNLCGLFVRIIDSKVYLVHQTAREFLIKGSSLDQGNWRHSLCYEDSNYLLADICISYLSLDDFENDPFVMVPNGNRKGEELAGYKEKYALLDYVASHWAGHFRDSADRQRELFEFTRGICKVTSKEFLTWLWVYWSNSHVHYTFPYDFTHLMIALWLGQRTVVQRLLGEGEDVNARSKAYGTALNVAAFNKYEDITRILMERDGNAYLCGREYNILQMVCEFSVIREN
ncbi:hypothetical protein C7212DRAFT_357813 [Tuber magnatum]|uniref:Uncharacterized protein n=1 Tax=Tuber magnatum TaxID=42249 RepID=A0A317SMR2_9PEZI|nr:hypothetical protein C7212DRAFT_357813 [Tuber magnatum]